MPRVETFLMFFNVFITLCYVIRLFLMRGSIRDQGFHEGVDSLKSWPTTDIDRYRYK